MEMAEERHKDALETLVSKMARATTSDLKKVTPPMFKGKPGEDPEVHALRVEDWFDFTSTTEKTKYFRLTLDGEAHQWVTDLERGMDWDGVKKAFPKRFSCEG